MLIYALTNALKEFLLIPSGVPPSEFHLGAKVTTNSPREVPVGLSRPMGNLSDHFSNAES